MNCCQIIEKTSIEKEVIKEQVEFKTMANVIEIPIQFDFRKKELTKGRYKFYFNIESLNPATAVYVRDQLKRLVGAHNILGKQIRINEIDFDKQFKYIVADITIITNPIPVGTLLTALAVLAGLIAGYLVLEKVEKIIEISPDFLILLIVALIVASSFITKIFKL